MKCIKKIEIGHNLGYLAEMSIRRFGESDEDYWEGQYEEAEARLVSIYESGLVELSNGACDALIIKSDRFDYTLITPSVKHAGVGYQFTNLNSWHGQLRPSCHKHIISVQSNHNALPEGTLYLIKF